ncbi:hypothetical protein ACFL5V_11010 [Fibrobacterota bacterium]
MSRFFPAFAVVFSLFSGAFSQFHLTISSQFGNQMEKNPVVYTDSAGDNIRNSFFMSPLVIPEYDFTIKNHRVNVFFSTEADFFHNSPEDVFFEGGGSLRQTKGRSEWRERISIGHVKQSRIEDPDEPREYSSYSSSLQYGHKFKHPVKARYSLTVLNEHESSRFDITNNLKPSVTMKLLPWFYPGMGLSFIWNYSSSAAFSYTSTGARVFLMGLVRDSYYLSCLLDVSSRYYYSGSGRDESGQQTIPPGLGKKQIDRSQLLFLDLLLSREFRPDLDIEVEYSFFYNNPDFLAESQIIHRIGAGFTWRYQGL